MGRRRSQGKGGMRGYKDSNFNDRKEASAKAKQAILEKFRAQPGADDPAVIERQAARQKIIEAREVRAAERRAAREAEAARQAAAEAARRAEQAAREAEAAAREAERRLAERKLEAERKAARDRRYAARKARR